MKKVFIMAGEHSGDLIGAWYAKKLQRQQSNLEITAIGGSALQATGATLFAPITEFSIAGIFEIIKKLPSIFIWLHRITKYICNNNFDTVILIDYPGFNLRLLKKLKQKKPSLTIIYVAPPQVWIWGSGRVAILKKYCSKIVVMYPFEVAWYAKHGVTVFYEGSPLFERIAPLINTAPKKPILALLPGSRPQEIIMLMPLFVELIKKIQQQIPELKIILIRAESIERTILEAFLKKHTIMESIITIVEPEQKFAALAQCCIAITKPGTCTLELALLGIPSIVVFKVLAATYWFARLVTSINYMALPNLFLNQPVFIERIQQECKVDIVMQDVLQLYDNYKNNNISYTECCITLETLKKEFSCPQSNS